MNLYSLGIFEDYYYGFMTYDTSYLKHFDLYLYDDGLKAADAGEKAGDGVGGRTLPEGVPGAAGTGALG